MYHYHRSVSVLFFALVWSFVAVVPAAAISTGKAAPKFSLSTIDGESVSLEDYKGKVVVLEWFNQACPYVKKHYRDGDMQRLQKESTAKDVVWLTITSTHEGHKDYLNNSALSELFEKKKLSSSAMLVDTSGEVGKTYRARTTPHMFVISKEGTLVYQGAIDDNSDIFSDPKDATNYVQLAVQAALEGKQPQVRETDPYGCSVKYAK